MAAVAATSSVRYSITVDGPDRLRRQAIAWIVTATKLGAVDPGQVLVQCTTRVPDEYRTALAERYGVRVVPLPGLPVGPPTLNKLRQFDHPELDADWIVTCDCDLVFAGPLPETCFRPGIAAKLVDIGFPELPYWRELLERLGLDEPEPRRAGRADRETYRNNVNGGFYVGDREHWARMAPVWTRTVAELLPQLPTEGRYRYHADQIAFGVTCARLGVDVALLPEELNFPLHLPPPHGLPIEPIVIHHHQDLRHGALARRLVYDERFPGVVAAIDRVNAALAEVDWTAFVP
jgi:hypothetical protein